MTQGPWEAYNDERNVTCINGGDQLSVIVCEEIGDADDASLIASAPDLLRSLRAVVNSLESYCAMHNSGSIGACCMNRKDARAVIMKAEGEIDEKAKGH